MPNSEIKKRWIEFEDAQVYSDRPKSSEEITDEHRDWIAAFVSSEIALFAEEAAKEIGVDCPSCPNVGYYSVPDMDGDEEQAQCEFCYTTKNSVFNIRALVQKYAPQQAEKGKYDPS